MKPPCDRFRLVVPFHSPIWDLDVFEYNMRHAIKRFRCDESCADGARFYFPCIDIHVMAPGSPLAWQPRPQASTTRAEREARSVERHRVNASRGVIPKWIHVMLKQGVPSGGRHKACYKLCANLTHYGFSADEIVALAMDSPLSEIGADDVSRAVANGVKRARGG